MRLVIHMPLWGRLDIARLVLENLAAVRAEVAPAIDLRIACSVSEDGAHELAWELADIALPWPNLPLGAKCNRLLLECRELDPDAVMILGSDDLVDAFLVSAWAGAIRGGYDYVGLTDFFVLDLEADRLAHFKGYETEFGKGRSIGAGRCFSRSLLDRMGWVLWRPDLDRNLDSSTDRLIESVSGDNPPQTRFFRMADAGRLVDIKDGSGLWSFWKICPDGGHAGGAAMVRLWFPTCSALRPHPRPTRTAIKNAGLAMLVRGDATDSLGACLASSRHYFDEAVACVDTRHGDDAIPILREYGVSVDRHPFEMWTDRCPHFANMRMRAFSLLKSPWGFWIDSDEVLETGKDLAAHVALADEKDLDAVGLQFTAYERGEVTDNSPQVRGIRLDRVRMKFPVHNMPCRLDGSPIQSRIDCVHTRFRTDYAGTAEDRYARSGPALEKLWHHGDGGDRIDEQSHAAYFLARHSFTVEKFPESIEWARKLLDLQPDHAGYADIHRLLVQALWQERGFTPALSACLVALRKWSGNMDLWHQLMAMAGFGWVNAAGEPRGDLLGWSKTREHLGQAEAAFQVLGLPLKMGEDAK